MILVDANLLLYAYDIGSPHHKYAANWLEDAFADHQVGLAWQVILAFLRISTNPRGVHRAISMERASQFVTSWLEDAGAAIVSPGAEHWRVFRQLTVYAQVSRNMVMDAHLAALAIEHGCTLYTTDRDFTRFPGLKHANPLTPAR